MYHQEVSSLRSVDRASADSGQTAHSGQLDDSMCRYAGVRHTDHPAVNFSSTLPIYRRCMYDALSRHRYCIVFDSGIWVKKVSE